MLTLRVDLARVPGVYELEQRIESMQGCVGGLGVMSRVRGVVWRKARGWGGLMPEVAWAWPRPSHGMGKGALWGIGKGGMGLGSSHVADFRVLEGLPRPKVNTNLNHTSSPTPSLTSSLSLPTCILAS